MTTKAIELGEVIAAHATLKVAKLDIDADEVKVTGASTTGVSLNAAIDRDLAAHRAGYALAMEQRASSSTSTATAGSGMGSFLRALVILAALALIGWFAWWVWNEFIKKEESPRSSIATTLPRAPLSSGVVLSENQCAPNEVVRMGGTYLPDLAWHSSRCWGSRY